MAAFLSDVTGMVSPVGSGGGDTRQGGLRQYYPGNIYSSSHGREQISRPLRKQAELKLPKAGVAPAAPLVKLGRRVPLVAQVLGEGKAQTVDIGLQVRGQVRHSQQ